MNGDERRALALQLAVEASAEETPAGNIVRRASVFEAYLAYGEVPR